MEQKHKFDPMGIPGVFAGYDLAPGLHWSRKYRVWSLADWTKQDLAYNTGAPIRKLKIGSSGQREIQNSCRCSWELHHRGGARVSQLPDKEEFYK